MVLSRVYISIIGMLFLQTQIHFLSNGYEALMLGYIVGAMWLQWKFVNADPHY